MESLVEKVERKERSRRKWRKIRNFFLLISLLVLFAGGSFYYYFPFAKGVKSGQLNYVVYKGVLFKTYEGKLIQSGIWSERDGGIQSNEFVFSVADKAVAEQLMSAGGQTVELHYTEYLGAIPWRGSSHYVVDRIVSISPLDSDEKKEEEPDIPSEIM